MVSLLATTDFEDEVTTRRQLDGGSLLGRTGVEVDEIYMMRSIQNLLSENLISM